MPANRSTRRPRASGIVNVALGLDAGAGFGRRDSASSRRALGAWEKDADSTHRCARAVRTLMDIELGDAQPERFDGFRCGGHKLGPRHVQGGARLSELV